MDLRAPASQVGSREIADLLVSDRKSVLDIGRLISLRGRTHTTWAQIFRDWCVKFCQLYEKGVFTTYILQAHSAYGHHDLMDATPKVLRRMDEALLYEAETNCTDRVRNLI